MLKPYKMAFRAPLSVRFKKNETVIGIIGHTHGVKMANNPPNRPNRKIIHNDLPSLVILSIFCMLSSERAVLSNSHTSGAVHILSSHALKRMGVSSAFASVITNESTNSCSYSLSPNSMMVMCQFGSIVALSRTLSPISSPDHLTGCTSWAFNGQKTVALKDKIQKINMFRNRFIYYSFFIPFSLISILSTHVRSLIVK